MRKILLSVLICILFLPSLSWAEVQTNQWLGPWKIIGPFQDDSLLTLLDKDWLSDFGGESTLSLPQAGNPYKAFSMDIPVSAEKQNEGYADINKYFGYREKAVVYALYDFEMNHRAVAQFKIGTDDGAKVWCNGKEYFRKAILRGAEPDQDTLLIPLQKGENRLLLKIIQGDQGWGFYTHFTRLWPVKEGKSACLYQDIYPATIFNASQFPLDSFMIVDLLNNGTMAINSTYLLLEWDKSNQKQQVLIPDLKPSEKLTLKIPLVNEGNDTTAVSPDYKLSLAYDSSNCQVLFQGKLLIKKASPLLQAKETKVNEPLRIVQISDPHIASETAFLHKTPTADNLKAAINQINALQPAPDFVVVTGDIVHDSKAGFSLFTQIMNRLKCPWIAVPGERDFPEGEGLTQSFFNQWNLPLYYSFNGNDSTHIIVLNTFEDGSSSVSQQQLYWLRKDINANKAAQILVFTHDDLITGLGIKNPVPVLQVLSKASPHCYLFSGHLHTNLLLKDGYGIKHILTPSTSFLFPELKDIYPMNLPAFRMITVTNEGVKTELVPLGGAPQPDPSSDKFLDMEGYKKLFQNLNWMKLYQQITE
jgi:hypothetical protein